MQNFLEFRFLNFRIIKFPYNLLRIVGGRGDRYKLLFFITLKSTEDKKAIQVSMEIPNLTWYSFYGCSLLYKNMSIRSGSNATFD